MTDLLTTGPTRKDVTSPDSVVYLAKREAAYNAAKAKAVADIAELPEIPPSGPIETNHSIFQSLLLAASEFAHRQPKPTRVFFSFSWTTSQSFLALPVPPRFAGAFVVAAGNENGTDFITERINFASRLTEANDTITVVNINGGKLDSTSSTTKVAKAWTKKLVGYNGVVGNVNGTSFAAPRVAWILAFGEAMGKHTLETMDWQDELLKWIAGARENTAEKPNRFLFDPVKYLGAAAVH
jgi:hypothetical protein